MLILLIEDLFDERLRIESALRSALGESVAFVSLDSCAAFEEWCDGIGVEVEVGAPDVAVVDIMLPYTKDYDVQAPAEYSMYSAGSRMATVLRESFSAMPVVFHTVVDRLEFERSERSEGIHVRKQESLSELVRAVKDALGQED